MRPVEFTQEQIVEAGQELQAAGRVVARTLDAMSKALEPGITTRELDQLGRQMLELEGARSAPELTYNFPGATCISVGPDCAHGIPDDRILLTGGPMMHEVRSARSSQSPTVDLLWAPHWIEDYFGKGSLATWRWVLPVLLQYAVDHPEQTIMVRPHPFLDDALVANESDPDAIAFASLLALPNVSKSDRSIVDDVLGSAALLSEGMSLNVYFATTGQPLGMTRGTVVDLPSEWLELLAVSDELRTADEVASWLDRLPDPEIDQERIRFIETKLPSSADSPIAQWNRARLASNAPRTRS